MNWLTIKNFGRVKYFNISYLALLVIPILIDYSGKINQALHTTLVEIPISIRLIYGASLCYAFGIALYQYFCPKVIKHYDKVQDFIRDNYQIHLTAYPDLKLSIVMSNLTPQQGESRTEIEDLAKKYEEAPLSEKTSLRKDLETRVDFLLPSCVQSYLATEFNSGLTKNRFLMWLSFLLYLGGTLILIGLLVEKTVTVFNL